MTDEQAERLGFREWTTHYEKEQQADREKVNSLVGAVSEVNASLGSLTADVRTLMENQRGMAERMNKPANWGIFATFAAVIFMIVGLVITDIKENIGKIEAHQALDIERNLALHMWFRDSLDTNNEALAAHETELKWFHKMEKRMNQRMHGTLIRTEE